MYRCKKKRVFKWRYMMIIRVNLLCSSNYPCFNTLTIEKINHFHSVSLCTQTLVSIAKFHPQFAAIVFLPHNIHLVSIKYYKK